MTAKEIVLKAYPEAGAEKQGTIWNIVNYATANKRLMTLGCKSQEDAWLYVASRLPTPVEPKAQPEEKCLRVAGIWSCSLREGHEGDHIAFDYHDLSGKELGRTANKAVEPKAQVESASVEMSPKERQKGMDDFCTRKAAELLGEPKEVESGALPDGLKQQCPRCGGEGTKQERGFASDMDAENEPHLITKSCYFCHGKGFIYPTQEELIEELKASLLREKELRGLLESAVEMFEDPNQDPRSAESVLMREIKAAVTGE